MHMLATFKHNIAYYICIAQMFLTHCQPAAAVQTSYHYQGFFSFWMSGSFFPGRYRLAHTSSHLDQENEDEKGLKSAEQFSEILSSNNLSLSRGRGLCCTPGLCRGSCVSC